ncbi:MAG: molybdopterin-dependent oxidoreductase [Deltaproteobacteria bacterium]|nr:molybdopterin-dependent oxidoreductase [Deltaproteobacteria bacterium]
MNNDVKKPATGTLSLTRRRFLKLIGAIGVANTTGTLVTRGKFGGSESFAESRKFAATKIVKNVCHQCPGRCGIDVYVSEGRVYRILGSPEHPISNGKLCAKGYFGMQILYDPDRFKAPMKRTNPKKGRDEDPDFVEITWEEALDTIASRLKSLRDKGESHRLALLSGRGWGESCAGLHGDFGRLYGSPNVAIRNGSLGDEGSKRAHLATDGNNSYNAYDYDNCNYLLNFGAGLLESFRPLNYFLQRWGIFSDKFPITKVTSIDVRTSTTLVGSDRSVLIKPGTDGAMALGIAHVILTEGLWNKRFVGNFTDGINRFKTGEDLGPKDFNERWTLGLINWWNNVVKTTTPKWASGLTGVSTNEMEVIARELAVAAPHAIVLMGRGPISYTNGVYNGMAIHALNALTGSLFAKGGIMYQMEPPYGPLPVDFNNYMDDYAKATAKRVSSGEIIRIDKASSPEWPMAETMMQEVAGNHLAGNPYKLDTVIFYQTNPIFSALNCKKWEDALKDIFVIETSPFPSETAVYADIVIPDHTYLERYQDTPIFPTYGFPTTNIRVPAVKPLYNTRYYGDVLIEIGKRMGGKMGEYYHELKDSVNILQHMAKGFEDNHGDNGVKGFEDWVEKGVWYKRPYLWRQIDGEFYEWDGTDYRKPMSPNDVRQKLLKTPSGRFELKSRYLEGYDQYINKELGIPPEMAGYPQWVSPRYTGGGKLHLITPKMAFHAEGRGANIPWNIEFHQPYTAGGDKTHLEINPKTARRLGINNSDRIRVSSAMGSIDAVAKYYEGCQPDVLILPYENGHWAHGRWAKGREAGNSNEIVENLSDPISGTACGYSIKVNVTKI